MTQIGITPDEALHLVGQQGAATDALRNHMRTVEAHINSLASATYVSATTQALRAKWEGETKPQLEKIIARSETAQAGTKSSVAQQMSTQDSNASSISAI
jgi:hypothetical protein